MAAAVYLPAAAGAQAWAVWIIRTDGRPDADDVYATEHPIVAWKIVSDEPEPVFLSSVNGSESVVYQTASGGFVSQEGDAYGSLGDAKRIVLVLAQLDWDQAARKSGASA